MWMTKRQQAVAFDPALALCSSLVASSAPAQTNPNDGIG
jgi:hypothetical protein